MGKIIGIFLVVFLILWGVALFLGYTSGYYKKIKFPEFKSNVSRTAASDEQRKISQESKELKSKTMQDYQYQIRHYKDTLRTDPAMGKF